MQQTRGKRVKLRTVQRLTWWGQAHGPWFLLPVLGEYERVQASAKQKVEHKIYVSNR